MGRGGWGGSLLVLVLVGGFWGLKRRAAAALHATASPREKIPSSPDFVTPLLPVHIRNSRELAVEGELQHCNTQVSELLTGIYVRDRKPFMVQNQPKMSMKNKRHEGS